MDFNHSLGAGVGLSIQSEVWGKLQVKMSETFHVNTNKHKMLCTTVILICNKIKNYLQKLIHKNVEVF